MKSGKETCQSQRAADSDAEQPLHLRAKAAAAAAKAVLLLARLLLAVCPQLGAVGDAVAQAAAVGAALGAADGLHLLRGEGGSS